jgi:hypothetical protein
MVGRSNVRAVALAIAALGIAGVTVSGCATTPDASLSQKLRDEGAAPGSIPSGDLRPDGTLNNGLLPQQWGDTS